MLPTQQHTPPTAATKATPVLTNVLRYLMPVPVYLFIILFRQGVDSVCVCSLLRPASTRCSTVLREVVGRMGTAYSIRPVRR